MSYTKQYTALENQLNILAEECGHPGKRVGIWQSIQDGYQIGFFDKNGEMQVSEIGPTIKSCVERLKQSK